MSIHYLLPATLVLPTSLGFLFAITLFITGLAGRRSKNAINRQEVFIIFVFLFFSLFAFTPGVLIGSNEADNFLLRSMVATTLLLIVFSMLHNAKAGDYVSHLRGVVFFSTGNSVIVILTALFPSLYEIMMIAAFSGSEKSATFLRSPGLLQGYDAAGFTAVIGLTSLLMLSIIRPMSAVGMSLCYLTLLLSTALSSRTSLALFSVYSLFWIVKKKSKNQGHKSQWLTKLVIATCATIFGSTSAVLIISVWNIELIEHYSFGIVRPELLSVIYNIGNPEDYFSHFDFSSLELFPNSNPVFLPDNSYLRICVSAGIWGIIFSAFSFYFIIFRARALTSGVWGGYFLSVAGVLFASSLKTNYLYYLPFFMIYAVALRASRAAMMGRIY